jgi:hypothetical protein
MIESAIFLAPTKSIFASKSSTFPLMLRFFLLRHEDEDFASFEDVGDHEE